MAQTTKAQSGKEKFRCFSSLIIKCRRSSKPDYWYACTSWSLHIHSFIRNLHAFWKIILMASLYRDGSEPCDHCSRWHNCWLHVCWWSQDNCRKVWRLQSGKLSCGYCTGGVRSFSSTPFSHSRMYLYWIALLLLHLTYELMKVKKTEEVLNYNNYGDELL